MNNQCQIQLCRLCLLEKGSYAAIYEANESFGFHIAEVINELLELDVSPGDGLPDNVCHDCLEEVARFKRFKNVCHEAKYTYKHLNILNDGKLINIKVEAKEDDLFEAVENEIHSLVCIKSEPTEIAEEEYHAKVVNVCSITHAEYEQHGINYMVKTQPNDHIDQNLDSINIRDGLKCPTHYQPPPTTLPSFLNAAQSSLADVKKDACSSSNSSVPVSSSSSLNSSEPLDSMNVPLSSVEPSSCSEIVSTCVQVNLEGGSSSSATDSNFVACHIAQSPSQLSETQVDSEQNTTGFADGQEDSDVENLCDEPLPVETVLSEPDTEVDHGNRSVDGIAVMSQNGEREDSFGMFPISSIINDLHQFSSYIPPGTRMEHSIFDKPKEPEVVDLIDDDDDDDDDDDEDNNGVPENAFPLAQTLASHCNESGSSRLDCDNSAIIKTEGNEDSDLENMCEHPLPVETVLSEPDGEVANGSGDVKCENTRNAVDGRDDSFGLFSLTSTFGDLMTSPEGEVNGCMSRTQHTIINAGQLPQNNSNDVVARPLENPNKYPFWCQICGKNFMRKDKLKQHSVVHSNERPFICRICGCSYKRKDKLTSHVTSSHLQHLPHQCDICGKRFVRKDKLKQHSVVHSNRRPYLCKECGKRYKSKTELKKHEKRAHSHEQTL